jgi:hypothetical protein
MRIISNCHLGQQAFLARLQTGTEQLFHQDKHFKLVLKSRYTTNDPKNESERVYFCYW